MKILELFAGTRSIGRAFEKHGHKVTSIDINPVFDDCIIADAYEYLKDHGEEGWDVIWASPCCTTYSVAGIRLHRSKSDNGRYLTPIDEYAKECDKQNTVMFKWFNSHRDNSGADHHPKDKCAFENMMHGAKRSVIPNELCDHIVKICEEASE